MHKLSLSYAVPPGDRFVVVPNWMSRRAGRASRNARPPGYTSSFSPVGYNCIICSSFSLQLTLNSGPEFEQMTA
eukprot:scaffold35609_cov42-Prasinocladus_malaysianus.AAC.1